MNLTDNSLTKIIAPRAKSAESKLPSQYQKENKIPLHFNSITNNIEKIDLDKQKQPGTGEKKATPLTESLRKIKFNPDVTFQKTKPAVFKKFYDMGKF